ncbi:MAG TPA: butyrate kinase [Feifaniaceae bacterium]|nr:butyrate kinase [Feifaniaceae bacterium]
MENKILVINTGSTSTKLALYKDETPVFCETIRHPQAEMSRFDTILDQYEYRRKTVLDTLIIKNVDLKSIDAVVGRGGLLHPMESGTYEINDLMLAHLKDEGSAIHASKLSCILAHEIASGCGAPAFTVDPIVVDEMDDIARITGCKDIRRYCIWHALNQKAVAKCYAEQRGEPYETLNLIVAHIGGGCTVGAHRKGRVVDVTNALSGEGPFTAERSGSLPASEVAELFASGKYGDINAFKYALNNKMGLVSLLGTNDGKAVQERVLHGDAEAEKVYRAMAYQIAKEIGATAAVLRGTVDAVLLTGGFAYDRMFTGWIGEYVGFVAPVTVIPGEDEMAALAMGALRVLRGKETIRQYKG